MMTDSSCEEHSAGFPADVPDGVSCKHGLKLQDHLHIKKEEEELWESLQTDITAVIVKSEDEEEEAQCSLENIKGEPATCSSAKLLKVEPNGDMSEGPDAANSLTQQDSDKTGENPFTCDICGKQFKFECVLKYHMKTHPGEKPFGCGICGKRFTLRKNLKIHKRIHMGKKPYECDVCQEIFNTKLEMISHMEIHMGKKPYECDVCSHKYTDMASFCIHMREKPYCCEVCGQSFVYQGSFTKHMCKKSFDRQSELQKYMLNHTGEKSHGCDVCQERFNTKLEMISHMGIHTGEKPLCCDFCGKAFSSENSLSKHISVHTGVKCLGCDVCGKEFNYKSNLSRHMMIHTRAGVRTRRGHHVDPDSQNKQEF